MTAAGEIMAKLSLTDDECLAPVRALAHLVAQPAITKLIVLLPQWIEVNLVGAAQQNYSVLGPFFRLTSLPDDVRVGEKFFAEPSRRDPQQLQESLDHLRTQLHTLCTLLHQTLLKLLRSKDTRDAVVAWFAVMLESNAARAKYVTLLRWARLSVCLCGGMHGPRFGLLARSLSVQRPLPLRRWCSRAACPLRTIECEPIRV